MGLDDPLRPPGRPRRVDEDRAGRPADRSGMAARRAASVASVAVPSTPSRGSPDRRRDKSVASWACRSEVHERPRSGHLRRCPVLPRGRPGSRGTYARPARSTPRIAAMASAPWSSNSPTAAYPAGRAGRPGRRSPWRARPAPGSWSPRRARGSPSARDGHRPRPGGLVDNPTRGSSPSVASGSSTLVSPGGHAGSPAPRAGRRPPRCRSRSRSLRLSAPAGTSGRPGTLPSARGPSG